MNKKIRYILLILTLIFIGNSEVLAFTIDDCNKEEDCVPLCSYVNESASGNNYSYEIFLYYRISSNVDDDFSAIATPLWDGASSSFIIEKRMKGNKIVISEEDKKALKETGKCPVGGYADRGQNHNKICFGDKNLCKNSTFGFDKFEGKSVLNYQANSENLKSASDKYVKSLVNCDSYSLSGTTDSKTQGLDVKNMKNLNYPDFFKKYILTSYNEIDGILSLEKCIEEVENSNKSESEKEKAIDNLNKNLENNKTNANESLIGKSDITTIDISSGAVNCSELLGESFIKILNNYFYLVYIIVPILVILLGMIDFAKAAFSNEDEMKKAQKRFLKRLIMGVAVFLIPTLINIVFYIVNTITYDNGGENYFKYIKGADCVEDVSGKYIE